MEFKMERPGLVEPGQIVDVTEGVVAAYFYYTIEPAVAMSANYRSWQRLKSGQGKVIDVKQTPQGYYVVCEFDEEDDGIKRKENPLERIQYKKIRE